MTNRKNQNGSDYLVGYKRPPKASQFKPGRSGNPKGRPKGSRSVGAIVAKVLGQKIAVTENGETRLIPAIEVAVRRLANDAMRGVEIPGNRERTGNFLEFWPEPTRSRSAAAAPP